MQLTQEIKDYIFDKTIDCYRDIYQLDINKLCEKLKIKLFKADFQSNSTSGIICANKDKTYPYQILLNSKHPITRKRFTACHELGHYISYLHNSHSIEGFKDNKGYKDEAIYYRNDNITSLAEIEANLIAEELLMPEYLINHFVKNNSCFTLEGIAERFFISSAAMDIKLNKLKLL